MPEVWLVCEGGSDAAVLSAVLTSVLSSDILVKPAGGSTSAASVARYLSEAHGVKAACVVDRDYRRREECESAFKDGTPCFFWRRHAIESYLLEPAVIAEAFVSLKASLASLPGGGPAHLQNLPVDVAILAEGLRSCASRRAPQEAGHIALRRLWEDLSDTAGRIQVRVPSVLNGVMAPDAVTCRQALLDEGSRLVTKASETVASPHLTAGSISGRYDQELARVTAADYLADLRFLEEFNVRELLGPFLEWLQQNHHASLLKRVLLKELRKAVPTVYRRNRAVYGTDDFLDLANGVRALAGLSPIS